MTARRRWLLLLMLVLRRRGRRLLRRQLADNLALERQQARFDLHLELLQSGCVRPRQVLQHSFNVAQKELHLRRAVRGLLLPHPPHAGRCGRGLLEPLELVQQQLEVGRQGVLEQLLLLRVRLHDGGSNGGGQRREEGRGEHAQQASGLGDKGGVAAGIFSHFPKAAAAAGQGEDLVGVGGGPAPEDVGVLQLRLVVMVVVLLVLLVQAMVVVVGRLEGGEVLLLLLVVVAGLVVAVERQAYWDQNVAGSRHDAGYVSGVLVQKKTKCWGWRSASHLNA